MTSDHPTAEGQTAALHMVRHIPRAFADTPVETVVDSLRGAKFECADTVLVTDHQGRHEGMATAKDKEHAGFANRALTDLGPSRHRLSGPHADVCWCWTRRQRSWDAHTRRCAVGTCKVVQAQPTRPERKCTGFRYRTRHLRRTTSSHSGVDDRSCRKSLAFGQKPGASAA